MMDIKVSVILPIYNVERYLERCISSVVNQTYNNLEIILVDDGSPDMCPQICDTWGKKDNRIKVIHKKNAGLGMARNTGIENATGKYICFFDSDDYIELDAIEKGVRAAEKYSADIVLWGFYDVDKEGKVIKSIVPSSEKDCFKGADVQSIFLPALLSQSSKTESVSNLWISAWTCLLSLEKIRELNWRFVSERDVISEDVYSFLFFYRNVERIALIKEPLYYYCENETSLTHVYREDRFDKINQFYLLCTEASEKLEYNEEVKNALCYPYIANVIAAMKMIVTSNNSARKKKADIRNIMEDDIFDRAIRKIVLKRETLSRRILFVAMRMKMYWLVYILINFKA